jgi:hypothetical protein
MKNKANGVCKFTKEATVKCVLHKTSLSRTAHDAAYSTCCVGSSQSVTPLFYRRFHGHVITLNIQCNGDMGGVHEWRSSVSYKRPNMTNPQICGLNEMRCNTQYATYATLMWTSSSRDASSSHKGRCGKDRNIPLNIRQQKQQYSRWLRKDENE